MYHVYQVILMKTKRELATLLAESRIALMNARNEADLQAVLQPFGYNPVRLDEGLALIESAETEAFQQENKYAERSVATLALQDKGAAARAAYVRHVKLARVAFEPGTPGYTRLALAGRRRNDRAGWMTQARLFYDTLLDDAALLDATSAYTLDREAVEAAQAALDAVETAQLEQVKATSRAQAATRRRDEAVAALRRYMKDFNRIARIATEPHPQLREKMGMLDRS